MLLRLLHRELLLTWRNLHSLLQPLLFFALTTLLYPIALGTDAESLRRSAPAALWLSLTFATLLASESLYHQDYQDGTLSQDRLSPTPLWISLSAKLLAAWLRFILPLLLILPLLALMLRLPFNNLATTGILLSLSSASLLLIASIGATLTLHPTHPIFLRYLIVLPLYIPTLIVAISAHRHSLSGLAINGYYALLSALAIFSALLAIPFSALAIKNQPLP